MKKDLVYTRPRIRKEHRLTAPVFFFAVALAAVLIAIAVCWPPAVAYAATYPDYPVVKTEAEFVDAVNSGASKIDIRALGWKSQGKALFDKIRQYENMTPCLDRGSVASRTPDGDLVYIKPHFDCDASEIESRTAAYRAEIDRIASNATGTTYERAWYVYKALMDKAEYCTAAAEAVNRGERELYYKHCTGPAALLDGSAICTGYAAACVDLFRAVGLDAWIEENDQHAWVGLTLDGRHLTCDPTKQDTAGLLGSWGVVDFFMIDENGVKYEPASPVVIEEPAPTAAPAPAEEAPEPTDYEEVVEDDETPAAPTTSEVPERVLVDAVKVRAITYYLRPANETIYQAVETGEYDRFTYESGFTLYTTAYVTTDISGKRMLSCA